MLTNLQKIRDERERGFTLIELLVVILIIGILSAIAIPAFLNQRKSAVDASVQSDVSNAAKQVETWVVKQGATVKPIPTVAADAATDGTKTISEIKVSDGTTLTVTGDSFHYVIIATNPGGDKSAPGAGFKYDSAEGGFKSSATAITGKGTATISNTGS